MKFAWGEGIKFTMEIEEETIQDLQCIMGLDMNSEIYDIIFYSLKDFGEALQNLDIDLYSRSMKAKGLEV